MVLNSASIYKFVLGQMRGSLQLALRAIDVAGETGDLPTIASACGMAASAYAALGESENAIPYHAQSLEMAERAGSRMIQAMNHISLLRRFSAAQPEDGYDWEEWRKGITLLQQGEDYWGLALGYQMAAMALVRQKDYDQAGHYAEMSIVSSRLAGGPHLGTAMGRSLLAEISYYRQDFDTAEGEFRQLLISGRDFGNVGAVARVLELLGFIARARAEKMDSDQMALLERAIIYFGAAAAMRETYRSDMVSYERVEFEAELKAIRDQLQEQAFIQAWARGKTMSVDEAVTYATTVR